MENNKKNKFNLKNLKKNSYWKLWYICPNRKDMI